MSKKGYEAQFSIYKLDYERGLTYLKNDFDIEVNSLNEFEETFHDKLLDIILSKQKVEYTQVNKCGFKGIFFKTSHVPNWSGMAKKMLEDSNNKLSIANTHISYILTYNDFDSIFLLTAGLGSGYISNVIKKNYGLYLLPKLISGDSPTVKSVLENKMIGNRVSSKRANRSATTVNLENELSSIFRELALEFNESLIQDLGIDLDESKKKNILNIIAKDSFVVRKSLSLEELSEVLKKMVQIEKRVDNFSLGYFVSAKKSGYKTCDINSFLNEYFCSGKYENFAIVGDDYSEYYIGCNNYKIEDKFGKIIIESSEPITLEQIYKEFFKNIFSKNRVEEFLKLKISTENDDGPKLYPLKLKEAIQGFIETPDNNIFYLFNDEWLIFDKNYLDRLSEEYKKSFNKMIELNNDVKMKVLNYENILTENNYNCCFDKSSEIILAHKVLVGNVELADLIYFDEFNLYLFHNKQTFDGNGARDVLNQILTSAELLENLYSDTVDRKEIFANYYYDIKKKYFDNGKINEMTEAEFVDLFNKRNIHYVAGFLENLSIDTHSNYAKYLVIDINKRLATKKYNLYLLDVNERNE